MKTLRISLLSFVLVSLSFAGFAQTRTEKFAVAGECGMCEKKIEKAAKEAGASFAEWDKEAKMLTVKFEDAGSSVSKIQQAIARVGYDTPQFKATDEAYNNLDGCCQYERTATKTEAHECGDHKNCSKENCKHEGECPKGETAKGCCKKA